jgi:recombinational DNA repair protein (RecF pathway)
VQYATLNYEQIRNILSIVTLIFKTIPEGITNTLIFEDFLTALPYLEDPDMNELAKNIFELKLTKYL